MIQYLRGNLLESTAQALVNPVNTIGVMGKGLALQFKLQFPHNYKLYRHYCQQQLLHTGNLLVTEIPHSDPMKLIINFPTKTDWKLPAQYEYIESGLAALKLLIQERKIQTLALPALGAGNGQLDWQKVKNLIHQTLSEVNCLISVYEPNPVLESAPKKVSLTPARAMLLTVLYDLVHENEFVSEFAAEKICYFLQRFGAQSVFKLDFQPYFYGPYSGKVRHVLHHLNGAYLSGFEDKNKQPFDELDLFLYRETEILHYLNQYPQYAQIAQNVKLFLSRFYTPFSLELLSSVDYLAQQYQRCDPDFIQQQLWSWNDRKKSLFQNKQYIEIACQHLMKHQLIVVKS